MGPEASVQSGEAVSSGRYEMFKVVSSSRNLADDRGAGEGAHPRQGRLTRVIGCRANATFVSVSVVSRFTVREALRMLEAGAGRDQGRREGWCVRHHAGARRGWAKAWPTCFNLSPMTASNVTEARQIFELGIVPMVVDRATDEDIAAFARDARVASARLRRGEYDMSMWLTSTSGWPRSP